MGHATAKEEEKLGSFESRTFDEVRLMETQSHRGNRGH